jgi:hypothetical protein
MDGLLTADNLPVILGIVLSATVLNWVRDVVSAFVTWRKGASEKERNIIRDTLAQLERCNHDRDNATDERDEYRRAVGRRDYLLLANGIPLPDDSQLVMSRGTDTNTNSGTGEPETRQP